MSFQENSLASLVFLLNKCFGSIDTIDFNDIDQNVLKLAYTSIDQSSLNDTELIYMRNVKRILAYPADYFNEILDEIKDR